MKKTLNFRTEIYVLQSDLRDITLRNKILAKKITFALAKLLEFHILELKISNFLIQYKFLTCERFPCYGLLLAILMPIIKEMKIL